MGRVSTSKRIAAPEAEVFYALTDFENAADRVSGILRCEVLTDGPVGRGTKIRETRKMFGKEATEEMEVTSFDPPSSYTLSANSHGCKYVSTISVRGDGQGGSIVDFSFDATPVSLMARIMTPLMKVMAGSCKKMMEQDLEDIRTHVESAAAGSSEDASPQPA